MASRVRVELVADDSNKKTGVVVSSLEELVKCAANKLRVKNARLFLSDGSPLEEAERFAAQVGDGAIVVAVKKGRQLSEKWARKHAGPPRGSAVVRFIHKSAWTEEESLKQLREAAAFSGMQLVVGQPDLHPGRGIPIGCSCASQLLYPHLVGGDIGCGMTLLRLETRAKGNLAKRAARWAERLQLDSPLDQEMSRAWLEERGVAVDEEHLGNLGTIGSGNHFAELLCVEDVENAEQALALGVEEGTLYLLVHSGSRSLGKAIGDAHIDAHGRVGLEGDSDAARDYMAKHDMACAWAYANRQLIARRFVDCMGVELHSEVLNVWHNAVVKKRFLAEEGVEEQDLFLHRKGAAPSDVGPVIIPGSRGAYSYLVMPAADDAKQQHGGYSLPHGAGRKHRRDKARKMGEGTPGSAKSLLRTSLDSVVVCEDKALLYEEAPTAYKDISAVIEDCVAAETASVIAVFRPVLTYKMRAKTY